MKRRKKKRKEKKGSRCFSVHAPNCFSTKEDEIEKIKDEIKRK
jgi:hypothetical protein